MGSGDEIDSGGTGGVLTMRMQVILDSSFRPPGFSPYMGAGRKGEFRTSGTGLLYILLSFHSVRALEIHDVARMYSVRTRDAQ